MSEMHHDRAASDNVNYDRCPLGYEVRRRFWAKVARKTSADCWLWTGAKGDKFGHGALVLPRGSSRQKHLYAHRASWMLHYGPIPAGMQVNHHCDVPRCVNPDHLYLGTQRDNVHDAVRRGRYPKTHTAKKLPDAAVLAIRHLAATGTPQVQLARAFNVTKTTVSLIVSGQRRQHLATTINMRRSA